MGKTLDVARDRAFDQTSTVLPAEVARGTYMRNAPSLAALKIMHLMIGKAGGRMADDVRHELRLSELREIEGMRNHDRASLAPLFAELAGAVLVNDAPEKMVMTIGGLLDEARIDYRHEASGDLLMTWYFGRTFRRMAAESNHWAILDRQTVFHLGSKYSVLLFQHISSLVNLDRITAKTFTIPELRAVLGIPEGKIQRFANLKKDVLDPAISEINQLSRLVLTAMPNKTGRTVASVMIAWEVKDDPASAKRELDGHSTGRKARRAGTVETVAPPPPSLPVPGSGVFGAFPFGSISFTPWAEIARQELPLPRRDIDLVADEFRQWCASRNIALNAGTIEKTFRGFCRKVQAAT